jgi:hypothetical protein
VADVSRSYSRCATPVGGISSAVTNSYGMTLDREWSERVAALALIGKVTKHRLSLNVARTAADRSRGANRRCPSSVPWLLSAAVFEWLSHGGPP